MVGRLAREVAVWSAISHPNIVPILGFTATPLVSVISPWFEQGNLHHYLKREPGADRLKLSLDIATGLAYIHSLTPPIVHGDLKPENILIGNLGEAVIGDLGMYRVIEEYPQRTPTHWQAGSVRWMAPELLLNKGIRSTSADVWSFGMVWSEVMAGNLPYSDLPASPLWFAVCDPSNPSNPKDPIEDWDKYPQLPGPIKEMMVKCWSRWPERRPSMRHVEEGLARLLGPRSKGVDVRPKLETLQPDQAPRAPPLPCPSPSPSDPAWSEIRFVSTEPSFRGWVSEPKGKPDRCGGSSDVWKCRIRFCESSDLHPVEVAVKVLRKVDLYQFGDDESHQAQEAITWSGLSHPNIVPMIGYTLVPSLGFISPWYRQGSLRQYLDVNSNVDRQKLLHGIAKALDFLHSRTPRIAHGDLKPENILIDEQNEPRIADFGLATILGEEHMYTVSHQQAGTWRWMAPEQILGGSRSCESDTYSFGSLAFWVRILFPFYGEEIKLD
ncbi:hypothetical protein FRC05_001478 [Tulasnella sp. 425]|nr:hypothetical protein FRC05_001478 [Tulasnella sp. 425]